MYNYCELVKNKMPTKKSNSKEQTVVVLGMHRSGTSMLGSVLHNLGVEMVSDEDKARSEFDNVLGFYENYQVALLNESLLKVLNASWDNPPKIKIEESKENYHINKLRKQAAQLVDELHTDTDIAGIKEPRMAILMDFWKDIISGPKYVFIFRNPLDVAKSLNKRQNMPIPDGLELAFKYNSSILEFLNSGKQEALVLRYEDFLTEQIYHVRRLINYLGLEDSDELIQRGLKDVEPVIRHNKTDDKEFLESKAVDDKYKEQFNQIDKLYKNQLKSSKISKKTIKFDTGLEVQFLQEKIIKLNDLLERYKKLTVEMDSTITKFRQLHENKLEEINDLERAYQLIKHENDELTDRRKMLASLIPGPIRRLIKKIIA